MNHFLQNYEVVQAIILSLYFTAFALAISLSIFQVVNKYRYYECLITILFMIVIGVILSYQMEAQTNASLSRQSSQFQQDLIYVLILVIFGIYFSTIYIREKLRIRKKITINSIKDALDNMPIGLSFSHENGLPYLVNHKMVELVKEVSGRFRNTEEVWQDLIKLENHASIKMLKETDHLIFQWSDDKIWSFSKRSLFLGNQTFYQTTAEDITEQYSLSQKLEESNVTLDKQYDWLSKLLEDISYIIREEEILAFKVRIHNEIGECLLNSKQYMTKKKQTKDYDEIFNQWNKVMSFIEITLKDEYQISDYAMNELIEAAEALDCKISFIGASQEEASKHTLLKHAIREAMTNAIRHAQANEMKVYLDFQDDFIHAIIKNNATTKVTPIIEGSGLSNLRKRIEQAGGSMNVHYLNDVELHLQIPVQEG